MCKKTQSEESTFRCGYCGFDDLSYAPYEVELPPEDWSYAEGPHGEDIWITSETVEAYRCYVCGSLCIAPDEVFWATDEEADKMGYFG